MRLFENLQRLFHVYLHQTLTNCSRDEKRCRDEKYTFVNMYGYVCLFFMMDIIEYYSVTYK